MNGFNGGVALPLEQVRAQVIGKDSSDAARVLKNNGFGYLYTEYPVVVWRRGPVAVELHYFQGRISDVKRQEN